LPYSFSPATTATVPVTLAAAGVDEEIHPAANSTAVSPTMRAATFASPNIILRCVLVIAGVADAVPAHPLQARSETPPGLVWIGFR
jgi:hypothetical protein